MKNLTFCSLLSVSLIIFTSCQYGKHGMGKYNPKAPIAVVGLDSAFQLVYKETQDALKDKSIQGMPYVLDNIDLAFETSISNEGSIGVELFVNGKYTYTKKNSQKTTFSFGEEKAKGKEDSVKLSDFSQRIVSVIRSAKDIKKADKFDLQEIEVEIAFTITHNVEVGAKGDLKIVPLTIEGSYTWEKEYVNTITLKFKRKEDEKPYRKPLDEMPKSQPVKQ